MVEVYPIEAEGGSAREVEAIHQKGFIDSTSGVCATWRPVVIDGDKATPSPPRHAKDERVLPLDV